MKANNHDGTERTRAATPPAPRSVRKSISLKEPWAALNSLSLVSIALGYDVEPLRGKEALVAKIPPVPEI